MSKVKVIKKIIKMLCGRCHKTFNGTTGKRESCPQCKGKGTYNDYNYTIIVGKYAYDGDTLK